MRAGVWSGVHGRDGDRGGGRSNREIAQDLFVTVNTIESHMRHVFQKLAITRRKELAQHG